MTEELYHRTKVQKCILLSRSYHLSLFVAQGVDTMFNIDMNS